MSRELTGNMIIRKDMLLFNTNFIFRQQAAHQLLALHFFENTADLYLLNIRMVCTFFVVNKLCLSCLLKTFAQFSEYTLLLGHYIVEIWYAQRTESARLSCTIGE